MSGAEIAILLTLVQAAIKAGKELYDDFQLQQLAELEAKLQAQLAQTHQDRAEVNANIDERHKKVEEALK